MACAEEVDEDAFCDSRAGSEIALSLLLLVVFFLVEGRERLDSDFPVAPLLGLYSEDSTGENLTLGSMVGIFSSL